MSPDTMERLNALVKELNEHGGDEQAVQSACKMLESALARKTAVTTESNSGLASGSTNMSAAPSNQSYLLELPAELRPDVYDLCVDRRRTFTNQHRRKGFSPLTQVNREIRDEVLPRYYRHLEFNKYMAESENINIFLRGPGAVIVSQINNFDIRGRLCSLRIRLPKTMVELDTIRIGNVVTGYSGVAVWAWQLQTKDKLFDFGATQLVQEEATLREDGSLSITPELLGKIARRVWWWNREARQTSSVSEATAAFTKSATRIDGLVASKAEQGHEGVR